MNGSFKLVCVRVKVLAVMMTQRTVYQSYRRYNMRVDKRRNDLPRLLNGRTRTATFTLLDIVEFIADIVFSYVNIPPNTVHCFCKVSLHFVSLKH